MNRNKMIKWLQETTIPEQWGDNCQLPKECHWRFTDSRLHDCNYRSVLRTIVPGSESDIFFENIFEQPVFIDGAEYIINPLKDLGLPLDGVKFTYDRNTNRFNGPGKVRLNASDFGKVFTVELAVIGQPPETPDYILTGKGNTSDTRGILKTIDPTPPAKPVLSNINALASYLTMTGSDVSEIAGEALSRLKAQNSLYERVVKALGERKVPIGGVDHLVGQVQVDHKKATLLDKIIEEFNIPEGGNVIKWLHNRTEQTPVPTSVNLRAQPRNKYDREILPGVHVDVYDVLGAFKTDSAAIDHAVKKLLAPGQRGVKDRITDLNEAINSIQREIERLGEWGNK